MRPIVVLLFDGLGDRAYPELNGQTASEAAATPCLDAFAARGSNGLLWPLGRGRAPSSELAHWELLGYRPDEFPGRAVLEARGWKRVVEPTDVYAYAALRPVEERDGALWVDGWPGPDEEGAASLLVGAVMTGEFDEMTFRLSYLHRGQAILQISGRASSRLTDTDPFFSDRQPVLRPRPLDLRAEATAQAVEKWSRWVVDTLRAHLVNRQRSARGEQVLAAITLKWWGRHRPAPTFVHRHGLRGAVIGAAPFLAGLAETLGLEAVRMEETDEPGKDLDARLDRIAELLEAGKTFVLSHQKATDEAAHTEDCREKVRVLQELDAPVARLREEPFAQAVVCITGDHATPALPGIIHSGDPVPLAVGGPGVRSDAVERFGELWQAGGILGHLGGADVLPLLLNAADRPLFLGSRPTNVEGAMGHPELVEPLPLWTEADAAVDEEKEAPA